MFTKNHALPSGHIAFCTFIIRAQTLAKQTWSREFCFNSTLWSVLAMDPIRIYYLVDGYFERLCLTQQTVLILMRKKDKVNKNDHIFIRDILRICRYIISLVFHWMLMLTIDWVQNRRSLMNVVIPLLLIISIKWLFNK